MVGVDSEHRHQTTQRYSCPQAIPGDMESGLAPDRVQCMRERESFRSEGRGEESGMASQCELRETSSCESEKEREGKKKLRIIMADSSTQRKILAHIAHTYKQQSLSAGGRLSLQCHHKHNSASQQKHHDTCVRRRTQLILYIY